MWDTSAISWDILERITWWGAPIDVCPSQCCANVKWLNSYFKEGYSITSCQSVNRHCLITSFDCQCWILDLQSCICWCRSLIERCLSARLVYQKANMARAISFEYLNRQLVWHELSELLLFILPLVSVTRIKRMVTNRWPSLRAATGIA